MNTLEADIIVAVHSQTRPISRAVGSVLDHTQANIRVTVVAHNIDPEIIRTNLGHLASDPRLRLLALTDGIPSPAGPLNYGLDEAEAPFVAIMGSDDAFEPGAIDSWLSVQRSTGASTVIARIFHTGRGNDSYPPVRRRRSRNLDGAKDRLAYRSAPLGLISREKFGHLRFTAGLPSGEDLAYTTYLWFHGEAIAFDRAGPAYVGFSDAVDRVTSEPRAVADDFRFLDEILPTDWFLALSKRQRRAICIKILRVHMFDSILSRTATMPWTDAERAALSAVIERITDAAPGVLSLLSMVDREVLDTVTQKPVTTELTIKLLERRWNYKTIPAMLPRNVFLALHRQGPFRTLFAGLLVMAPGPFIERS
ncbi:glycosyltransferase family A protein [Salinibacterium sp. PAMC 21357]|uniref:glycosyltransferase family A protein n=1 Tax=Salinibacterium sp. PAMC 21357 TaxID=1112215 RepID=UPI000288E3B4|nr:glycosyltransferase family A protein [Salinibacterium sp. PAMC 21357]